MENILKIFGVALMCVSVSAAIGAASKDISSVIKIASATLLAGMAVALTSPLVEFLLGISESTGLGTYIGIMLKSLGIAFLTHICSSVCRDCGDTAVAGYAELAGRVEMLIIAIPLIEEIIDVAERLVQMI